ncbi:MAG TPA: MEDS domain-containing protein [Gemmatimonadales bacterium]|nr:MEDS domain-containing protein [Gemmatimonadales bacterium]
MDQDEDLLDIRAAARFLKVSTTSLRRWTNSGELPHLRIGGRRERRFRRGDLLALLEGNPRLAVGSAETPPVPQAAAGAHFCALCAGKRERVAQAARFLANTVSGGGLALLVTSPKRSEAILAELGSSPLRDGVFVTEPTGSTRDQLDYFEARLTQALRSGPRPVGLVIDLSEGGPEQGRPFARVLHYEREYERRIARSYPVTTLCLYDVRRLSGLELMAALQAHPDAFSLQPPTCWPEPAAD